MKPVEMDSGILQRSLVCLILFVIHLNEIVKKVEDEIEGCMTISFADNCW